MKRTILFLLLLPVLLFSCGKGVEHPGLIATDNWGIYLSVEDVTPTGLTLVITQSGGEHDGELEYGTPFSLEQKPDGEWVDVPYTAEGEVAWTMIAYLLEEDSETELEISWEYLYGQLQPGDYRLGKSFQNFRETGDYDTELYWVQFTVE